MCQPVFNEGNMAKLIVVSTVAGRHRAGEVFTGAKAFELNHFSAKHLREIVADQVLSLSVGELVDAGNVEAFIAEHAPEPKAEKVAKGK